MLSYVLPSALADRERPGFSAIDLPLATNASNASDITLTSRYPETGLTLNASSEMIVRILEGGATVFHSEGEEIELSAGATILVPANRPYYWRPKGMVRLYVVSTPPWTKEQQRPLP